VLSLLAGCSAAQAATVPVQSLSGDFTASNSTVTKTPDGVHFGTYADVELLGGSRVYSRLNGTKLSDVTDFSYAFTYRQGGTTTTTGAAPYARIFLDANPAVDSDGDGNPSNDVNHDVILDPSLCATQTPDDATDLTFAMSKTDVRVDDDPCDSAASIQSFAQAKVARGNDTISGLLVSHGFSTGTDVSALLRSITVTGTTLAVNVPPATGQQGPAGPRGPGGAPGAPGRTIVITVGSGNNAQRVCAGNVRRTLRIVGRKHERFLSARATLRGKALKVRGRRIVVDLRKRTHGDFNVRIVARFRRANGTVRVVRTVRTLTVACS
jgi:hypothetical protein